MTVKPLERGPFGLRGICFYGDITPRVGPFTLTPKQEHAALVKRTNSRYVRVWDAQERVAAGGSVEKGGDKERASEWLLWMCIAKWGDE